MITIICGPPGCGKTHNAEALRQKYKCAHVMDFDEFKKLSIAMQRHLFVEHVLLLTTDNEAEWDCGPDAKFVAYEDTGMPVYDMAKATVLRHD